MFSLSAHCILAIMPSSVPASVLSKFGQNPNSLTASTKKHAELTGLLFDLQDLSQGVFRENPSTAL